MTEDLLMTAAALGLTCALLLLRHLFIRGGYNKGAVVKVTKYLDHDGGSGGGRTSTPGDRVTERQSRSEGRLVPESREVRAVSLCGNLTGAYNNWRRRNSGYASGAMRPQAAATKE